MIFPSSEHLTEEEREVRIEAVKIMARAICSSQGPRPLCLCSGNGHCHALTLYGDFAISALLALEKEGFMILPPMEKKVEESPV